MGVQKKPSLRAQILGRLLRDHRERAGLRAGEAGERIQRDQSSISRMESGYLPARVPDIEALLRLYGVDDPQARDTLISLSQDIFRQGWADDYANHVSPAVLDFPWLERRSNMISSLDTTSLGGLIQTRDYAEACIRAVDPDADEAQIQSWIEFRMARQQVLHRPEPPQLRAVLDEALFHRPVGGSEVMQAQLTHLLELTEKPAIEIRVMSLSSGAYAGVAGSFQVFSVSGLTSDIAWSDTLAGVLYVEADQAVRYTRTFARVWAAALDADTSRRRIEAAAEQMR